MEEEEEEQRGRWRAKTSGRPGQEEQESGERPEELTPQGADRDRERGRGTGSTLCDFHFNLTLLWSPALVPPPPNRVWGGRRELE